MKICFKDTETGDVDLGEVVYRRNALKSNSCIGAIISVEWDTVRLEIGDAGYVNYLRELLPSNPIELLVKSKELNTIHLAELSRLYPAFSLQMKEKYLTDKANLFDFVVSLGIKISVL